MKTMKKQMNVVEKILAAHLVEGDASKDTELGIRIDQTLTQDATGTMAYLQFESMGVNRVKTDVSVSYVDHNTVQIGLRTPTTMTFCSLSRRNTASSIPRPATASAISCTSSVSESRAQLF